MAQQVKNLLQSRRPGSMFGSGKSPGEGNGNPLQYSCLGNPVDREAWRATVHGVIKEHHTTEHQHIHLVKRLREVEEQRFSTSNASCLLSLQPASAQVWAPGGSIELHIVQTLPGLLACHQDFPSLSSIAKKTGWRCSETGGPGINQVHLQILGDGGRILFLAKISLGKGCGRYQLKEHS